MSYCKVPGETESDALCETYPNCACGPPAAITKPEHRMKVEFCGEPHDHESHVWEISLEDHVEKLCRGIPPVSVTVHAAASADIKRGYRPTTLNGMLTHLTEECAEVIQTVSKIQRFGLFSHHPERPDETNVQQLAREMTDLKDAWEILQRQLATAHGIKTWQ